MAIQSTHKDTNPDVAWQEAQSFGEYFRVARVAAGLSQHKMEEKLGLSYGYVSLWEGDRPIRNKATLEKVLEFFRTENPAWFDESKSQILRGFCENDKMRKSAAVDWEDAHTHGGYLNIACNKTGYKRHEIAAALGVSNAALSLWESDNKLPSPAMRIRLIEYFKKELPEWFDAEKEAAFSRACNAKQYAKADELWNKADSVGQKVWAMRVAMKMPRDQFEGLTGMSAPLTWGQAKEDTFSTEQLDQIIARVQERAPSWLTEEKIAQLHMQQTFEMEAITSKLKEQSIFSRASKIKPQPVEEIDIEPLAEPVPEKPEALPLTEDQQALSRFITTSIAMLKEEKTTRTLRGYDDNALVHDLNKAGHGISGKWTHVRHEHVTDAVEKLAGTPELYIALERLFNAVLGEKEAWRKIRSEAYAQGLASAVERVNAAVIPDTRINDADTPKRLGDARQMAIN